MGYDGEGKIKCVGSGGCELDAYIILNMVCEQFRKCRKEGTKELSLIT